MIFNKAFFYIFILLLTACLNNAVTRDSKHISRSIAMIDNGDKLEAKKLFKEIDQVTDEIRFYYGPKGVQGLKNLKQLLIKHDDVINKLHEYLVKTGFSCKKVEKKISYMANDLSYYAIDLTFDGDLEKKRGLQRVLKTLHDKGQFSKIEINLYKNAKMASKGSFSAMDNNTIFVSEESVESLMVKDDLGGTIRHELEHAYFESNRRKGIESIYDGVYSSIDGSPMESISKSSYHDRVRIEELYTWVNSYSWMSVEDFLDFDPDQLLRLEESLTKKHEGVEKIILQMETMAKTTIDSIDRYLDPSAHSVKEDTLLEIKTLIDLEVQVEESTKLARAKDANYRFIIEDNKTQLYFYNFNDDLFNRYLKKFIALNDFKNINGIGDTSNSAYNLYKKDVPERFWNELINLRNDLLSEERQILLHERSKQIQILNIASSYRASSEKFFSELQKFLKRVEYFAHAELSEEEFAKAKIAWVKASREYGRISRSRDYFFFNINGCYSIINTILAF